MVESDLLKSEYSEELTPILHRILEISAKNIQLHQVPNWPRDSLPKSPIIQKLALITIPILYPWWTKELELELEQFGPYSPIIAESFNELLITGKCSISENQIEIQPSTFQDVINYPEITEIFLQKIISSSSNPILSQFENLELFSIISTEQYYYFYNKKILRRVEKISDEDQNNITNRILIQMRDIPHFSSFINERGIKYTKMYINEAIDYFYEAVTISFDSLRNNSFNYL